MKIELKSIKVLEKASDETHCFEAALFLDGKPRGFVTNAGHGGEDEYTDRAAHAEIEAYAKTLPTEPYTVGGETRQLEQCADMLVGKFVEDFLIAKDLRKALAGHIMFVKDGQMLETKRMDKVKLAVVLGHPGLVKKCGTDQILNKMPFDEALRVYREVCRL